MKNVKTAEIVLVDVQPFRVNWNNVEILKGHCRWLICNKSVWNVIAPDEVKNFDRVFCVDELNLLSVMKLISEGLNKDVRIIFATNDEYCLILCNELNIFFRGTEDILNKNDLECYVDKVEMKKVLKNSSINVPRYKMLTGNIKTNMSQHFNSMVKEIGIPFILKPCSESNSRGIYLIEKKSQLTEDILPLKTTYQAEEYIEGTIYFCDTVHEGREMIPIMIGEYINPPLKYGSGFPHGSMSLSFNDDIAKRILEFNSVVLSLMPKLSKKISHLELFMKNDGEFVFLEIAARAPGAYVAKTGELHQGINFEELNFRLQLGLDWKLPEEPLQHTAWVWFPKKAGEVLAMKEPELSCQHLFGWNIEVGASLTAPKNNEGNKPENASLTVVIWDDDIEVIRDNFEHLRRFEPVRLLNEYHIE